MRAFWTGGPTGEWGACFLPARFTLPYFLAFWFSGFLLFAMSGPA